MPISAARSPSAPPAADAERPPAARTTPKSGRTRRRILDAAMGLFAERGYHGSSNADVAAAAGLTRGAMLYHFPARENLVDAAIAHIQDQRTEAFTAAARELILGGEVSDQAIDAYWALLQQVPFKAFAELEAAARTDPALARRLAPAQAAFDQAPIGEGQFGLLQAGSAARFQTSRDLARFMLEGLSQAQLTYDRDERVQRLLAVVKRVTRLLNRKGAVQDLWED
jgi:AcrR family transcriptional regulator